MTYGTNTSEKNGSTMRALIIYDSFALAAKANGLLLCAAENSSCDIEWDIKPWRTDLLKLPNFMTEALADAHAAHLVILAIEKMGSFPYWLEQWLEEWAAARKFEEVGLAVLNEDTRGRLTLIPQAYRFAARHGLSLIYQPHEATEPIYACCGAPGFGEVADV
jgi:hypothetical protein